jgi:DNA-binding CsgD family transcriptional regulator
MHLASELASFLTVGRRSTEEITKFLALRTFSQFSATSVYFAEILDDGFLLPHSGFGFEKSTIASWGRFSISMHIPITDAIRQDDVVVLDSAEKFLDEYPVLKGVPNFPGEWQAAVAWPILPFGAGHAHFNAPLTVDAEFKSFLKLVGAIVAQHLMVREENQTIPLFKGSQARKSGREKMTDRQTVILELICKGATNREIANEIGFSESLVRQETMEIYLKLGVSGRKELIQDAAKTGELLGSAALTN